MKISRYNAGRQDAPGQRQRKGEPCVSFLEEKKVNKWVSGSLVQAEETAMTNVFSSGLQGICESEVSGWG